MTSTKKKNFIRPTILCLFQYLIRLHANRDTNCPAHAYYIHPVALQAYITSLTQRSKVLPNAGDLYVFSIRFSAKFRFRLKRFPANVQRL